MGGNWYRVAPKPGGDDDLALAHQLVVGAAAPAPVGLLYERGQLLQSQAPLLFQVEQLWRVEGGAERLAWGNPGDGPSQPVSYSFLCLLSTCTHSMGTY